MGKELEYAVNAEAAFYDFINLMYTAMGHCGCRLCGWVVPAGFTSEY